MTSPSTGARLLWHAPGVRRLGRSLPFVFATLLVAEACGSSSDRDKLGKLPTTSAATTSANASAGSGFDTACDPLCAMGTFCSATGICIPDGTCADPEDCGEGLTCDIPAKACVPGGACGGAEIAIDPVQPNLLVVLDRSCSMTEKIGKTEKWSIAVGALMTMINQYKGKFRLGITFFPDLDLFDCAQGTAIPIHPGQGNDDTIATLLFNSLAKADAYYPDGPTCVTNIDTAMLQAASEPALLDPTRDSYVMLVTDGKQTPTCNLAGGDGGTLQTTAGLLAKKVKTYVIGFGGTDIDKDALNAFADAGGTATPNAAIRYYDAADGPALDKAFSEVATLSLSCVYAIENPPGNPDKLALFFNDDPAKIPRDPTHTSGWDYDPLTKLLTFYGATCTKLKMGEVKDVDLVFGCDVPTPG